ncbi:hypothetical protein DYB37_004517 [Aphanomyces astaci]|nr:hypothetical protein DYB35_007252 [Aphanomyces astaci]RHZ30664.1 hypothetical protein DYB37_004517 [Aphanomyces astaci]RQM19088.1 hypothetical protein B5M09_007388 [Aphanomyces astaci]
MFGALMGHLGRAKKQLAQDSDLLQKQDRLLNAAEAKEKQQSQKVSTITQQRSARRKVESQIASYKRAAADKIAKLERKHALSISTERHQARFLQTVSPIPIFYLPARHTKETQALVDASTEAIEEKIQVERREIDAKKRDIELDMKRKLDALEAAVVAVDTKLSDKHHDDTSSQVDADDDAPPTRTLDDVTGAHTTAAPSADVEVSSPKATPSSPATKPSSPVKNTLSPVKEPSSPVHGAALVDVVSSPSRAPALSSPEAHHMPTSSSAIPDEATTEHCDVVATVCDTVDLSIEGKDDDDDEDVEEVIVPSKLKVVELRKALKDRGLDTKGLKDDLVKRLELALQK